MINLNLFKKIVIAVFIGSLFYSCKNDMSAPNTLSEKEQEEGWQLLFDGTTLNNWHTYNNEKKVPTAWVVRNGTIYCDPNNQSQKYDLVSNSDYKNYEFKFEWKLEKEGNSGIFVNVQERPDINATYHSGPEYQLLADSHPDFDKPLKRAGCLYTFLPQQNFVNTKAKDDWNQSSIVQKDGKITFYLNGTATAEMDFNSQKWQDLVKHSTFKDFPEFGKHTSGKLALQDWSRGVSFRNLKIKQL
ncbi:MULTISPECIES: 3-keto-disaccharide hydrolase [unclassified Sphingobacterium]|jgi:hypothetical protein|uniref:3-keto-disaccharide hydrolase n=1 Tax=unclassified Sphingobacterium TaxID=2609468 RepID=UPI0025DDA971|nr:MULTISPECIES: DUF1080 domain-containing protein [unclassified Sphingobacterium]